MYQVCRIDPGRGEKTYAEIKEKLKELARILKEKHGAKKIILHGSYVRKSLHEGSDIDLVVVGDFREKFHKRIAAVLELTDLPLEPLCYTEKEFEKMLKNGNSFLLYVVSEGVPVDKI